MIPSEAKESPPQPKEIPFLSLRSGQAVAGAPRNDRQASSGVSTEDDTLPLVLLCGIILQIGGENQGHLRRLADHDASGRPDRPIPRIPHCLSSAERARSAMAALPFLLIQDLGGIVAHGRRHKVSQARAVLFVKGPKLGVFDIELGQTTIPVG